MKNIEFSKKLISEPYRLFFPVGIIYLLCGTLIWLPLIWNPGEYPVLLHRSLMLNGFVASFIAGFLMTAVPRFSQTKVANRFEVCFFFIITIIGLILAFSQLEKGILIISALQGAALLTFLLLRIFKRKENPPYSFIFIFVGLGLWIISALAGIFDDIESFKNLHYEGAIASIILGVGSRLIPGILGHVEIVSSQRKRYEKPIPILSTIPISFVLLMFTFVGSYFLPAKFGNVLRFLDVSFVAFSYWKLHQFPVVKTALTWSIWLSGWFMVVSFFLKLSWNDGMIHASHFFFINGVVLLTLMIATRVLQSHGPNDKKLENLKVLYLVSFLLFVAGVIRVSAILLPEFYLDHLAYSSIVLTIAVLIWSFRYLRFALTWKR